MDRFLDQHGHEAAELGSLAWALKGAAVVNLTATAATLSDGGFSGGATGFHAIDLAADFEAAVSNVAEGKNVHPEFSDVAQITWPRPLAGSLPAAGNRAWKASSACV